MIRHEKMCIRVLTTIILCGFHSVVVAQQNDSRSIDELMSSLEAANELSVSIVSSRTCKNAVKWYGVAAGRRQCEIIRHKKQEKVTARDISSKGSDYYLNEYLVDKFGSVVAAQAMFDAQGKQKSPEESANLILMLSDKDLVADGTKVRDRFAAYNSMHECTAAIWVIGQSSLIDYLKGSGQDSLNVDGLDVSANGALGKVTLNLSPEHGWLPSAFTVEKHIDSRIGDETVGSFFAPKELPPSVVLPQSATQQLAKTNAKKMVWRGRVLDFGQSEEGVWYPKELEVVQHTEFDNGKVNQVVNRLSVEEVSGVTSASCELKAEIPQNHIVSIDGASHLPFRWEGTWPAPGIPDLPYEWAYNTSPVRKSNRLFLFAINLILFVLLSSLLALRWRNSGVFRKQFAR